jgi:hypothetical protein
VGGGWVWVWGWGCARAGVRPPAAQQRRGLAGRPPAAAALFCFAPHPPATLDLCATLVLAAQLGSPRLTCVPAVELAVPLAAREHQLLSVDYDTDVPGVRRRRERGLVLALQHLGQLRSEAAHDLGGGRGVGGPGPGRGLWRGAGTRRRGRGEARNGRRPAGGRGRARGSHLALSIYQADADALPVDPMEAGKRALRRRRRRRHRSSSNGGRSSRSGSALPLVHRRHGLVAERGQPHCALRSSFSKMAPGRGPCVRAAGGCGRSRGGAQVWRDAGESRREVRPPRRLLPTPQGCSVRCSRSSPSAHPAGALCTTFVPSYGF